MKIVAFVPRFCALLVCAAALAPVATRADDQEIAIEVTGKLATGIMAVGGETTGTTLTTPDGKVYELDLQKDDKLVKQANELKGENVTATGTLRIVKGVERGDRTIINVATLTRIVSKK